MANFKMVIISSILSVSLLSAGGLGDFIRNNLDGAIITTSPGYYKTQVGGLWYGGDLKVRWDLSGANIRLFHAQAPSFNGVGCNGIDAAFGAFSYLGFDQLVEKLKKIAAAAPAMAFSMAISTLCEQCETIMNNLEKIANQLNQFNIDACKASTKLAREMLNIIPKSGKTKDATETQQKARENTEWQFTKALESFRQKFNKFFNGESEGESGFKNLTGQGSVLNKALSKTYSISFMNRDEFLAIMRGIIGDIYGFCERKTDSSGKKDMDCSFQTISPVTSVNYFVKYLAKGGKLPAIVLNPVKNGNFYAKLNTQHINNFNTAKNKRGITFTQITLEAEKSFVPMFEKKINDIIDKIKTKQELTADDINFINSVPFPLYRYANIEATLKSQMTKQAAEYLAYLTIREFTHQFFIQLRRAVGSVLQDPEFSKTSHDKVKEWAKHSAEQYTELVKLLNIAINERVSQIQDTKVLIEKYQKLEQQMIRLSPLWKAQTL